MNRGGWQAAVHGVTQSWARLSESADTTGKAPRRGIPHEPDRCAPSGLQPNVFSAPASPQNCSNKPPTFSLEPGLTQPSCSYTACISQPLRLAPRLPGAPCGPMWWVPSPVRAQVGDRLRRPTAQTRCCALSLLSLLRTRVPPAPQEVIRAEGAGAPFYVLLAT